MKHLLRNSLTLAALSGPALAYAGEQDVKASFLLVGGLGGVIIGAGMYAALLVLAAAAVRRGRVLAALMGLGVGVFSYVQYWSVYFLAIALRFLHTRQMRYEFGPLPPPLRWALVGLGVWGLLVLAVALRVWQARARGQRGC